MKVFFLSVLPNESVLSNGSVLPTESVLPNESVVPNGCVIPNEKQVYRNKPDCLPGFQSALHLL